MKFKKFVAAALACVTLTSVVPAVSAASTAYGAATVDASVLNIRSETSTSSSILGSIPGGTEVCVLECTNSDWYRVNYKGTKGYVSTDYLTNVSTVENFDASGKTNTSCYMRSGPGTSNSSVKLVGSGKGVSIIGINEGWFKVKYDGATGYIRSDLVDITASGGSSGSSSESVSVTSGTIINACTRMRSGPSTSYSIVSELSKGANVSISGISDGWYNVSAGGKTGYIRKDLIQTGSSSASSSSVSGTKYVNCSGARVRSGPATSYSTVTVLYMNTEVKLIGSSGDWYQISCGNTKGYIRSDLLSNEETKISVPSSSLGDSIASMAKQYVGYRYVYGGASPSSGFDCSGLVYYVCRQLGYKIARTAGAQYKYGTSVSKSELEPGDLVFFSSNGWEITHIGVYIGGNQFVHASTSTTGVIISSLTSSYYTSVWWGARRLV